jgi:hypothetical protein
MMRFHLPIQIHVQIDRTDRINLWERNDPVFTRYVRYIRPFRKIKTTFCFFCGRDTQFRVVYWPFLP